MKTTLKKIAMILLFGMLFQTANAQVTAATDAVINKKSYWQLSSRLGYDFPMFKEDFKYIDYKGGLMGGLSVNKYWNRWGFQVDFDYINNSPYTNIDSPTNLIGVDLNTGRTKLYALDVTTQKTNLTRMFFGIGPAYKWQSLSNKWTVELAAMGGIAIINGGEILVEGANANYPGPFPNKKHLLTYHSGFDNEKALTFKAQARATYWFKGDKWGVNGGLYYMNHFGVNESQKNPLLISNGYIPNNSAGNIYFYQLGSGTSRVDIDVPGGPTTVVSGFDYSSDSEQSIQRENYQDQDERQKIKLASVGIFAGVSYRFLNAPKAKKIVEEKPIPVVEKAKPVEKKYCVQVTAKDKFTGEIIPNTDVALKNDKGEIISTARTDGFGITKFCDIVPGNYKISGVYEDVALEEAAIDKSEFKDDLTIKKEILYANRDFIIKGKAVECNTSTPIEGLSVVLEKDDKSYKQTNLTDAKGSFIMRMPVLGVYSLFGRKSGYFSQVEKIDASNYNRDKTLFVKLEICAEKADCGKGLGLKNILFDLNKFEIKDIAKVELNRLVQFMQDNPTIKVEVGSHTDCRASTKYNQTLSQNRANASVAYVVSQGIDKSRITGKGYGESKLLNECGDGVKCTEDQHSINRRTEMKVICPENK